MRSARMVKVAIVAAILLVGAGALALTQLGAAATGNSNAPFKGAPVPALFSDAQVRVVDAPLEAARRRGDALARRWIGDHPLATDAQFASWAVKAVGRPPGGDVPRRQ